MDAVGLLRPLRCEALHLVCSTNRVPLFSYELTAANVVADVLLVRELLAGAGLQAGEVARRLFAGLAYRSDALGRELADREASYS